MTSLLNQEKVVLFPKVDWVKKKIITIPAHIVTCVLEYIFLFQRTSKQTKKQEYNKSKRKERRKENISRKSMIII